jgi:hypothetical protein
MRINEMLYENETTAESVALGTGETPGADGASSAETLNPDTGADGTLPETIPYSRFKEVNDAYTELKPYKELSDVGYDANSLRQLAEFEAGFRADPVATWFSIASQIEGLPQEIKDMAQRHLTGSAVEAATDGAGDSQDGGEDMPDWAQKLMKENAELKQRESAREEREISQANTQLLDGIMEQWRAADAADDLKSPDERKMLTFIVAHARGSGNVEDILKKARGEWLELREDVLGSSIKPGGNAGAPFSVPSGAGSAVANSAGPPKTLAEASLRAKNRLEALERENA